METQQSDGTAAAAAAAPEVSGFATRVTNLFTSPGELFTEMSATPVQTTSWLIPFIALCVLTVVATYAIFNNPELRQQAYDIQKHKLSEMVAQGKLTQDVMDRQTSAMENSGPGLFMIIGAGSRILIAAVILFLGALFYWLGARIVLKYPGGYTKILEVTGLCWSIGILGAIITILLMHVLNSIYASPSPALLLGESFNPFSMGHKLLSSLNVFTIWETALIGLGLAKVSGKPAGGGMAVSFTIWAIAVVVMSLVGN